jgi:hypothetical protein
VIGCVDDGADDLAMSEARTEPRGGAEVMSGTRLSR